MFTFRPATESQVKATKALFVGYDEYRQNRYPIYIEDDRPIAVCAVSNPISPLSFLKEDSECSMSLTYRTIEFKKTKIMFGPAMDSSYLDVDVVELWFNREVFSGYIDFLKMQSNIAAQFFREHE